MRPVMLTGPLPRLIDHHKLANRAQELEGTVPLSAFTRLSEILDSNEGDVHLRIAFSKGSRNRTHISGAAETVVQLTCQNCLKGYAQPVSCEVNADIVSRESDLELPGQNTLY